MPVATIDPDLESHQVERVRSLRTRRSAAEHARALTALDDAAQGTANIVGPIVGAVKAMATVGEIADVLRERFGEYRPRADREDNRHGAHIAQGWWDAERRTRRVGELSFVARSRASAVPARRRPL